MYHEPPALQFITYLLGCLQSHDEMAFVEALHPGRRDAEIFDAVRLP
jgi:hypothetical protein|tara:strand:- start:552 stop:692 length:141 start_codon:yes stop_codon:yes gene_type:complete